MTRVWLAGSAFSYPANGFFWIFLNWALGLSAAGTEIVYFEHVVDPHGEGGAGVREVAALFAALGGPTSIGIATDPPAATLPRFSFPVLTLDDVSPDDVLVSLDKTLPAAIADRFRHSALIDIDPGITQGWIAFGAYDMPAYDAFFTVGEGAARHADGVDWQYVPPCVALDHWPVASAEPGAAFTTVTHWYSRDRQYFDGEQLLPNDKTLGFLPYFELPRATQAPLELAMPFNEIEWRGDEADTLRDRGWRLSDARGLVDPSVYRRYVQGSLGEFSCAKPAYVQLQTGWVSDRTVCYLASGKPAVVEHTGPSTHLPDRSGLLRFRTPAEAVECLDDVLANYDEHCRDARLLAEQHFDARKVATHVLEAIA